MQLRSRQLQSVLDRQVGHYLLWFQDQHRFASCPRQCPGEIQRLGSKSTVYSFSGRVQNDFGTKLEFGDGTFNVAKGVYGADLIFGNGSFHFGIGDEKCGDARYSLCASGKVTMDGPSTFVSMRGSIRGLVRRSSSVPVWLTVTPSGNPAATTLSGLMAAPSR